jgi:hypothetical protein
VNGTFTTIPGREHPGCTDEDKFASANTGTWNGVWTRKVTGDFDYNPDAEMTDDATWVDFLGAFFGLSPAEADAVPTTSYEFDYYNECGDQWRDAFYSGTSFQSGTIDDCS